MNQRRKAVLVGQGILGFRQTGPEREKQLVQVIEHDAVMNPFGIGLLFNRPAAPSFEHLAGILLQKSSDFPMRLRPNYFGIDGHECSHDRCGQCSGPFLKQPKHCSRPAAAERPEDKRR